MDIPALVASTGGQFSYGLSDNVPGIVALKNELYAKVLALPWVDKSALSDAFSFTSDGAVWSPNYAIKSPAWIARAGADFTKNDLLPGIPSWLTDKTHAIAWNTLVDWWRSNVVPVLAANGNRQATLLQAAVDDAAFWNALYNADVFVAGIPGKIADAASGVATNVFFKSLPLLLVAGTLILFFVFSRSQIRKVD